MQTRGTPSCSELRFASKNNNMIPQIIAFFGFQELASVLIALIILTVIIAIYLLPSLTATRAVRYSISH